MSRFMNKRYATLEAYTPGEQPKDKQYIKLNTNESPYPPAPRVLDVLNRPAGAALRLYSDPEATQLREAIAQRYGRTAEEVFVSNGSDDSLNFAFMAFGGDGAVFPALTYSFYRVFGDLHGIPYEEVPQNEDLSVSVDGLCGKNCLTVLANPNAPTGLSLPLSDIERILQSNPDHVVLVDEAYVDFGGTSAVSLLDRYKNLLVVMTYSKSRGLAGARLGFALGHRDLIQDLETLKYSTNPYNVGRLPQALGVAAMEAKAYYQNITHKIMETRERTAEALKDLGFVMPESKTNFLFIRREGLDGTAYYQKLKERGVLVRHFSAPELAPYNRVTIGTPEEMAAFLTLTEEILREEGLL